MIAQHKTTGKKFQVIKYTLRVIERGSDTDFGKEQMVVYDPESRSRIEVDRQDFIILNSWDD